MILENLLASRRNTVLKRWLDEIVATYPSETAAFLTQQKDRFLNPAGYTFATEIETIYDALLRGDPAVSLTAALDNIIRIRAIQDFAPSQAMSFVFSLKKAVRHSLGADLADHRYQAQLTDLEAKIDEIALLAFDLYMQCRQRVYEIKANELRNRSALLIERVNRMYGLPGLEEPSHDQAQLEAR